MDFENTIKRIQYQYLALTSEQKSKVQDKLLKKLREVINILNSVEEVKEEWNPSINEPLPPFYDETEGTDAEDERFSCDTKDKNLYDLWKNSSIDEKFRFVCSNDDSQGYIYFDKLYLERYTDELKDIKVDMWSYMNHHKILQVWLDNKNFMKIKRRKSIYGNPICGTMIRVFTICDEDFVTFHDSSSRDPNDSFMVKWGNVPQKIKEEIGTCTNNMLHYNFDPEENIFFWSFSLSKREFNRVVNLLTDGI